MPLIDLVGKRFGRLVAIKRARSIVEPSGGRVTCWRCACDCGKTTTVRSADLRRLKVTSCGCYGREVYALNGRNSGPRNTVHGHRGHRTKSGSRTYTSWRNMRTRARDEVCERWRKFAGFLEDMGTSPPGAVLRRLDNNRPFEPGNARWLKEIRGGEVFGKARPPGNRTSTTPVE